MDTLTIVLVYLPWTLAIVFGLILAALALISPPEVWTAIKIKVLPGIVGFILFDDAGQGTLKAMDNIADKGIFATAKDEYQIVATPPTISDKIPQYAYTYLDSKREPITDPDKRKRHEELVDIANENLKAEAKMKTYLNELLKKRGTLFGKPVYIGMKATGTSVTPAMLEAMNDAVDNIDADKTDEPNRTNVKIISVDVMKEVLTKAYPPARLQSIGFRHENRVRKKGNFDMSPGLIMVLLVVGGLVLLGATGVIDFAQIGKMLSGGL